MSQALSVVDLPAPPPPRPLSVRSVVTPGLITVRRYWKPFVLLQAAGLLLIAGYYHVPPVTAVCERLAEYQSKTGLLFAAVAAGIAGSLLPDLAKRTVRRDARFTSRDLRSLVFTFGAFAFSGVFTALQYRGENWLYGPGLDTVTVIKKVLTDQFVTTPIYGTPFWVVVYLWRRSRYNPVRTIRLMGPTWYLRDVAPLLVTGWAFWLPMCALIYSLPPALQVLLFCFALAGWSLLMAFVAE